MMATDLERSVGRPMIFICYAKPDAEKADEIYQILKKWGVDPWLDSRKLVLGDEWEPSNEKAIRKADLFLVLLRPGFDEVGFRQKEIRLALQVKELRPMGRGFIVPFVIETCEIPEWCQPFYAGKHASRAATIQELHAAVIKHCQSRNVADMDTPKQPNSVDSEFTLQARTTFPSHNQERLSEANNEEFDNRSEEVSTLDFATGLTCVEQDVGKLVKDYVMGVLGEEGVRLARISHDVRVSVGTFVL